MTDWRKGAFLLGVSIAFRAGAAADPGSAADTADSSPGRALEEITVTARKREESTQNIPVAVTALSGAQLERYNLKSIEQIAETTPQLMVVRGNSGSGATLSLRGIGSNFTSIGIEQSVAVIVDGVYYGQGRVINEAFFDMKQVEILNGPQALFFGKNATAGVLSFTSAGPGERFEAMGRTGYEFESKTSSAEAVLSAPITEDFGVRLALRGTHMGGGYVKNEAAAASFDTFDLATGTAATHATLVPERDNPGEKSLVGRLTAKYTPTDDLTLTLKGSAEANKSNNPTWNNELFFCESGSSQVNPGEECRGDWRFRNNAQPADIAASNGLFGREGGQLYQKYDSYAVTGTAEYAADNFTVSSVNGYHHFANYFLGDYDATAVATGGTWGAERSEYSAVSTENRVQTSFDAPLNFMAGVYYQSTKLDFLQDVIFPSGPPGFPSLADSAVTDPSTRYLILRKASRTEGETFAGFAQAIWTFLPDWELTAGARYTHETKDSYFNQPYVIDPFQAVFVEGTKLEAEQTFNNVSPEAALTWKATPDVTVYGAYKQGFKSGGFSGSGIYSVGTTVDDVAFDPEKVKGVEAGIKSTLLDRHLRVDVIAYAYEFSDIQVDFFDTAKTSFTTFNAGKATTRGIEVQADWAPQQLPDFVLNGSLSFNRARYKDFGDAPCYAGQRVAEGCVLLARPTQDLSGKATALAPDLSGSLGVDFNKPVGRGLLFGISGNMRYSDTYYLNALANPQSQQDSFVTFDGSVRLGSESNAWEVALIGRNLTNEYVVNGSYDAPQTGTGTGTAGGVHADQIGFISPPRTVALQVTARF